MLSKRKSIEGASNRSSRTRASGNGGVYERVLGPDARGRNNRFRDVLDASLYDRPSRIDDVEVDLTVLDGSVAYGSREETRDSGGGRN